MSVEHTKKTMDAYWSGHDPSAVAADAVFTDLATGRQWRGREEIAGMLRFMYEEAFEADFRPERTHFAEGSAAVEGRFVGRHIGAFAGVEATGKDVDVPLAVFYTVDDGAVTEGRVWFMLASFLEQVA
jgi:steroid delta-isomerase-like uncharacterized protein